MESITQSILQDLLSPQELAVHTASSNGNDVSSNADMNHAQGRQLQFMHNKEEEEQQASDEDGLQGGQRWQPPTTSPTDMPTDTPSLNPTGPPTYHPTPHGEPWVLKGTVWYDRNANGNRDSGISMTDFGSDVEYNLGLGGVKITLLECNGDTNREIETSSNTLATTISQGYDSKMMPMLSDGGGVYRLVNIKLDKSYSVRVEAPTGYLFTSGICNDNERGWKCEYSRGNNNGNNNRGLLQDGLSKITDWITTNTKYDTSDNSRSLASDTSGSHNKKNNREFAMGIASGRSTECITVDRSGIPDKALNFGVMRIGDSKAADADVALVLDFDDAVKQGRRGLHEMIRDATELPRDENDRSTVRRYLLGETDKKAIGSVTAEVLASQLDKRLAENQIVLDSVDPQDVILSDDSEAASKEVAVALNIKGHYSPPPELDFEYIVNDSINSDTEQIRRDLREYNQNCRDQNAKVQSGLSMSDFTEVHSMKGASLNNRGSDGAVYRTVCAEGETLPTMFETSLKEISATKVSEIAFNPIIYMEGGALAGWATGPVAAVSGLIALLMGLFVFRRALGPRKVDKYRQLQKTGLVDIGDERRFGEMGGDIDDGSVDSAFYSSDEEEYSDNSTKDKEKKMRAKLRAEAEKAKSNGKSGKKFAKMSTKKFSKSSKKLLAVKTGSADDTDSIPSSTSAKEGEKKRSKKSSKSNNELRDSAIKKSMRSSKTELRASAKSNKSNDSRKSKRGRDRSEGGDNAKIVDAQLKKSIV
jgi:hypothetical protein